MGKFDMDSVYSSDCELTKADLIKELLEEFYPFDGSSDTIYHFLHNHDESGLIDLLNKELEFDIEGIAGDSKAEQFNMYKLLKLLFGIEKVGEPQKKEGFKDVDKIRTPFIKILANPSTANIKTPYTTETVHGDTFEEIFNAVKGVVYDAEQRIASIDKMNEYWNCIIEKQFDYVISNMALELPELCLQELMRIHRFLKKILNQLADINPHKYSKPEGVLQTFFNIMLTHRQLCYERDRIQINYEICLCEKPCSTYCEQFIKYEGLQFNYEAIELVKRYLKELDTERLTNEQVSTVECILGFASYFQEIPDEDIKHYKYAFDKLEIVAKWVENDRPQFDFSTAIPFSVLITIIQEIVFLKKNTSQNSLSIDVTRIKCHRETLLSALKKEKHTNAILIQAWLTRIENRFCVNYGSWELIEKKRNIENELYKIKSIIFEYRNLDDLLLVNSFLAHFVGRSTTNRKYAMIFGNQFGEILAKKLERNGIIIKETNLPPEAKNVYDMFRELSFISAEHETGIFDVADQIANQIVVSCKCSKESCVKVKADICINYCNDHIQKAVLYLKIDRRTKILYYKEFFMVEPKDVIDRYCSLGLEKFCIQ